MFLNKKIISLSIASIAILILSGCNDVKKVSDEEASKLPICIETSNDMFTMSQGSIGEVGNYFNQMAKLSNKEKYYDMYPIKEGKQLIFNIFATGETILMDTRYQELEKGACMELFHTIVKNKKGENTLEAHSSNPSDYRTLVKVAEYVFKF